MTRGNFVLIEDGKIYMSIQFNGDMYPDYNGRFVYYMLQHIGSKTDLKKAIQKFDEVRFGYGEAGYNVSVLEEVEDLDFSHAYFQKFNSDYLYIKNADSKAYVITDVECNEHLIKPDEIQIWRFGKYVTPNENELRMSDEDIASISGKKEKDMYVYDAKSDIGAVIKVLVDRIVNDAASIRSLATDVDEVSGSLYTPDYIATDGQQKVDRDFPSIDDELEHGAKYGSYDLTFKLAKNSSVKENSFVYGSINATWTDDNDFTVQSDKELGLSDIAEITRNCIWD